MPILNYTTQVDSFKTLNEIQKILSRAGARKVIIDSNEKGLPVALTFALEWNGLLTAFTLPCNFEGVLRAMKKDCSVPSKYCNEEQALRVGWRIVKVWIEAQMAIIESQLVTAPEVFLPYAVTKYGTTMYKHLDSDNTLLVR